jgi:cell wall-associated NlpC family hydrolase
VARIVLAVLPVVVFIGATVSLMGVLLMTGSTVATGATAGPCSSISRASPVTVENLDVEQVGNAQTIVAVGRAHQVPAYGWAIALATAMQESTLHNLDHGDRDSVGLFQQRTPWGTLDARTDPVRSATMFYTGGDGGQPGLQQIAGWEQMSLTEAAQAVQRSAFPGAYARWETLARKLLANPVIYSATCLTGPDYEGDGTAGARAVEAAMQWLGTPYSWGGGGFNGPSLGIASGSRTVGFDCSGLVQYAWYRAAGIRLPRVTDDQVKALVQVPSGEPLRVGDLLFFRDPNDPPGVYFHVGIYDGQGNIIHAPRPGKTVEIVHDVLSDDYYASHLGVVSRPLSGAL